MKNKTALCFFLLFLSILFSCKRDSLEYLSPSTNRLETFSSGITQKIDDWIENHRSTANTPQDDNLTLLKQNLDYSAATIESRNDKDDLIIIPIKEELSIKKQIDKNSLLNLILIRSKSGRIRWGTIICFIPVDHVKSTAVPRGTFKNVFNSAEAPDGKYKFLNIKGKLEYQLEYKGNKVFGHGVLRTRADTDKKQINTTLKTNSTCTNWYLVTTYYYSDGSTTETWNYLGTTCSGCNDGMYEGLCPGGEGGGGTGSLGNEDPIDHVVVTHISESSVESNYTDDDYDYTGSTVSGGPTVPLYQMIAYRYEADETRNGDTGQLESVVMYNTVANPVSCLYQDAYGYYVTRTLTLLAHWNTWSISTGGYTATLSWSCEVNGRYVSSARIFTRQWGNSHTTIR